MEAYGLLQTKNGLLPYLRAPLPPAEQAVIQSYDLDYAIKVARRVAAFGDYAWGFRPAGSESAARCAAYLAAEMRRIGLQEVEVLEFGLDGWSFQGASVTAWNDAGESVRLEAVAYGGASGTEADGLIGELVDCGTGAAADYAGKDLRGKIALIEMDFAVVNWAAQVLLEAHHQGATGVVCWPKSDYAQMPGAIHTHDLQAWAPIPMLNVNHDEGQRLRGMRWARLVSSARNLPGATGRNIVGYLRGAERPEEIVIVGDHYDAWFHGFLDDAVGVGGVLSLAKAMIDSGYQPKRTIAFVLHDAEEYGKLDSPWDWCTGAWAMRDLKPDWAGRAVGALIYELAGYKESPYFELYTSPEVAGLAKAACDQVDLRAYPEGVVIEAQPTCWADGFSYSAGLGIPSIGNLETNPAFKSRYYHTRFDTEEIFDPERYATTLLVFALLALQLDGAPLPLVDLGATARALGESLPAGAPTELFDLVAELAQTGERLRGRADLPASATAAILRAVGILNRGLTWLGGEAMDETIFPHQQVVRDLAHLKAGELTAVSGMGWGQAMSYPVYRHWFHAQSDRAGDWQWAEGRISPPIDLWHLVKEGRPAPAELIAQVEGRLAGIYRHEIAVLREALGALSGLA
jgi:Iap family predicted aminopeptidase